jgi:hypothetical protein
MDDLLIQFGLSASVVAIILFFFSVDMWMLVVAKSPSPPRPESSFMRFYRALLRTSELTLTGGLLAAAIGLAHRLIF